MVPARATKAATPAAIEKGSVMVQKAETGKTNNANTWVIAERA